MITEGKIICFLQLSEQLNFSHAAHTLQMSQQAFSYQIAALEKDVGFSLFNRTTKSVSLTPIGLELYELFSTTSIIYKEISNKYSQAIYPANKLKIGVFQCIDVIDQLEYTKKQMPEQIPAFDYEVTYISAYQDMLTALEQDKFQLALLPDANDSASPVYEQMPLVTCSGYIFLSENHPIANHETVLLTDMKDLTFFLGPGYSKAKSVLVSAFYNHGFTPAFYDGDATPALDRIRVENGEGASYGTYFSTLYHTPNLRKVPIKGNVSIYAAWKKKNATQNLLDFMQLLSKNLKESIS